MDQQLDRLLAHKPIRAREHFNDHLFQRIREEEERLEHTIDQLLESNPVATSSDFLPTLRSKISKPRQFRVRPWWGIPAAAAASLAIVGLWINNSLETTRPETAQIPPTHAAFQMQEISIDNQTAQIFALAQNLKGSNDLASVDESIEVLALLEN